MSVMAKFLGMIVCNIGGEPNLQALLPSFLTTTQHNQKRVPT